MMDCSRTSRLCERHGSCFAPRLVMSRRVKNEAPPDEQHPSHSRASAELVEMALLAASAAHDAKGPLTYLLSNLEHLDRQLSTHERDLGRERADELRQCLREATLGARQVRDIVSDIPLPGVERLPDALVDLHRVLLSSIKVARTEIDHRARVITELDAVPQVLASESRLRRVAGDAKKEHFIRVVMRNEASGYVVVEITDSGPGILDEHLPHLFEPFFTTKSADQGTGLGLAVCLNIAEELGGTITVETTLGRGSTFRVALPTERAERSTDPAPRRSETRFTPSQPPVRRLPRRQLG